MKKLLLSTAFTLIGGLYGSFAMAGITSDQLVTTFQAAGYTHIEIVTGVTQMKVEAIQGTAKVEVVYDIATGAILKQEQSTASGNAAAGVEVKSSGQDFVSGAEAGDDNGTDATDDVGDDNGVDGTDDVGDDHGGSGNEVGDDNGGSGTEVGDDNGGSGSEAGDDNGGSGNSGSSSHGGKSGHDSNDD